MKFACASEITLRVMKSHFVSWYLAKRGYGTKKRISFHRERRERFHRKWNARFHFCPESSN